MKKLLAVVISLALLLIFVACGISTNVDSSSSNPFENADVSSLSSISEVTSSDNISSEIPPHACYDKNENGGYIGGDGFCDLCYRPI